MTIAIETADLTRRFGRTEAVNGLNLQVPAGSIFALLGPNGAGKTTTLKVLMNLVRATRGSATVLGVDSRRLGPREFERIGYVSEHQRLPEWMTPGQLFDYCQDRRDSRLRDFAPRLPSPASCGSDDPR
jgi:ABC-2 type transport system ATP-binding protein